MRHLRSWSKVPSHQGGCGQYFTPLSHRWLQPSQLKPTASKVSTTLIISIRRASGWSWVSRSTCSRKYPLFRRFRNQVRGCFAMIHLEFFPVSKIYSPCSAALLQQYFSANKQCFPLTTNQHKHQQQPMLDVLQIQVPSCPENCCFNDHTLIMQRTSLHGSVMMSLLGRLWQE